MSRAGGDLVIEEFDSHSYQQIAEVHNLVYPDFPMTPDEIAEDDPEEGSDLTCKRWIASLDGKVVAHSGYCQWEDTYKQGEFTLIGGVIPGYRRRGIGSSLFEIVLRDLQRFGADILRAHCRADWNDSVRFLEKRCFKEFMRERDWELNPADFDASPYADLISGLHASGIRIRSLKELESDPDRDHKLYNLIYEVLEDTPGAELNRRLDFDTWVKSNLRKSDTPPDGYFIAIDGSEYVGKTHFETDEASDVLQTRLTGVRKRYRRRGIALALKVRSISWARENGFPRIRTDNEINNEPMMKLNELLGFEKMPEWVFFERKLRGK